MAVNKRSGFLIIQCCLVFGPKHIVSVVIGSTCSTDTDCPILFAECKNNTCDCVAKYNDNVFGNCIASQTGLACGSDSDCAGYDYGACVSDSCNCDNGYEDNGSNGCQAVKTIEVGSACNVDANCTFLYGVCGVDKMCTCGERSAGDGNGYCIGTDGAVAVVGNLFFVTVCCILTEMWGVYNL